MEVVSLTSTLMCINMHILLAICFANFFPSEIRAQSVDNGTESVSFEKDFYFHWTTGHPERWGDDGEIIALKLTKRSGSGFSSRNPRFHGRYGANVKVPSGFSAGVITAFYLSSSWDYKWTLEGIDKHDEIDFEFLGNTTSGGVTLQTNWYAGGVGDHEERHQLWFDPAKDFHMYEIHWNWKHIVWLVDGIPIRETRAENIAGIFPTLPMFLMASLWEASSWATMGGAVKVDWTKEPYFAEFKDISIQGCYWRNLEMVEPPPCARKGHLDSWDATLSANDVKVLDYVVRHYRTYAWHTDLWRLEHKVGFVRENSTSFPKEQKIINNDSIRKLLSKPDIDCELRDLRQLRPWIQGISGWPGDKEFEGRIRIGV